MTFLNNSNNAENELRELKQALQYCHLDCEEILEDYREHLDRCRRKGDHWNGIDRRDYFIKKWDAPRKKWDGTERRS